MSKPKLVSLYSGAGGLDYGFEAAGFATGVAVEMDHDCCETLRRSRPRWNVIERSIFEVKTAEMLEAAGSRPGEIDLLIGGPPCQPFSKAGYWARGDSLRLDDPRSSTLSAYLRVVEEALPRAFLLENVEGLAYSGKDEGLKLLLEGLKDINKRTKSAYQPSIQVLNAADYGVPQLRERVFLVASRDGSALQFPVPTHTGTDITSEPLFPTTLQRHRTAWDAIGDLMPDAGEDLAVRGKWAELLPSIPEGNNYLWHTGAAVARSSAGAEGTGRSCSSSPRPDLRGHFKPNPAPPSAPSTGTTVASASGSCAESRPFRTMCSSLAAAPRYSVRWAMPFHRCSGRCSVAPFVRSSSV